MQETYTELEVIELLVSNNNHIMKLIDSSKYFVVEDNEVHTYTRRLLFADKLIRTYSFAEILHQARYGV